LQLLQVGTRQHQASTAIVLTDVHESFRPAYAGRMSTKHIRTAADLVRFGAGLKIDCRDCGSARTLDGYQAAELCGAGSLQTMQARLVCSRCGGKAAKLTVLPPI
jgi:hypothetical protein